MAQKVLRAIISKPKRQEQIPNLLVAASMGSELNKAGGPNADKEVRDLCRKFEDNEADIITDLYSRHFRPRGLDSPDNKMGFGTNDSIGDDHEGFLLDPFEDVKISDRKNQTRVGAPPPETYSKPLQDSIRYVQYIPKEARGTIEDVVNQLYHEQEIHRRVEDGDDGSKMSTTVSPSHKQNFWRNLASGVVSNKCQRRHRHALQCSKTKETDLSLLQSKAFKYMMLQKPADEPTGFERGKLCRASFFPRAKLPAELLDQIEYTLRFQR